MKYFSPVILAFASTLALSACVDSSPAERTSERSEENKDLQRGHDASASNDDSKDAQMAAARGNWSLTEKLAEQSYREAPDVYNEFNLATAYQRLGRFDLAKPLYQDLVLRGQSTETLPIQNFDGSEPPHMAPFIGQEAAKRLGIPNPTEKLPVYDKPFPQLTTM